MKGPRLDDPVRVLEGLLEHCRDGVAGYRLAADMLSRPTWLRDILESNAARREEMAGELARALGELGRTPNGSTKGASHRALIEALQALALDGPYALRGVMLECQRSDRQTLEAYSHALGRILPDDLHRLVQSQFGRLLEASAGLRAAILGVDLAEALSA